MVFRKRILDLLPTFCVAMVPQEYREEGASSQASRNSMATVKGSVLLLYDDCNIQAVGAVA